MWVMTTIGFYSVVRKPGETLLTIRSRVASDLDRLRARHLPSLSDTVTLPYSDYPYRATAEAGEWAVALADMGEGINYANFKSAVANAQGREREAVYHDVWAKLRNLELVDRSDRIKAPAKAKRKNAPAEANLAAPPERPAGADVNDLSAVGQLARLEASGGDGLADGTLADPEHAGGPGERCRLSRVHGRKGTGVRTDLQIDNGTVMRTVRERGRRSPGPERAVRFDQ